MLTLVLDTNVVLDWLVFDHPFMLPLRDAVASKQVSVITHSLAIDELRRVLAYPQLNLSAERQMAIANAYCANSTLASMPPDYSRESLLLPQSFPQCKDHDDQHFLALAYHTKAHALATRDKAILKLRKRALRFGVSILDVPQLVTSLQS